MGRLRREIWKTHPKFPDYMVSNFGRIRGRKILKPHFDKGGYLFVGLYKNKKQINKYVHRLVLETFVGECPEGHESNHDDGVKSNNFLSNLEWVTPKENIKHSFVSGLQNPQKGEKHWKSRLKEGEVWLIKRLLSNMVLGVVIAKMFRVSPKTISGIKNEKIWKHI